MKTKTMTKTYETTYETTEMINRLQDMANQILSPGSEGKALFEGIADRLHELEKALAASLELQCHYAGILNGYDSGRRTTTFCNHSWIKRLRLIGGIAKRSKEAPPPSSAFMNPPTESNESSDKLWKKTSTEAAQQLRDLVNDEPKTDPDLITPLNDYENLRHADSGWAYETMDLINKLTPGITGKAFDPGWHLLRERLENAGRIVDSVKEAKSVNPPPISNAHVEPGCEQFKPQSYKPIPHHTGGEFHV